MLLVFQHTSPPCLPPACHPSVPIVVAILGRAAALALLAGPGGGAAPSPTPAAPPAAPDALVDSIVEAAARRYMAAPGRVGLSVGVLRGGRVRSYHYGEVARGAGRRPTARTLYEIGSVTKTFTGHLLARAVTDGRLGLDDDVRRHLAPGDSLGGAWANLAYGGRPVRLVHLVNHTAGLPVHSVEFPPGAPPDTIVAREARNSDAALLARLRAVTLARAPGAGFGYSNAAFALAGVVLQRAYGAGPEGYEALVRRVVADPLGMPDTRVHLSPEQARRLARGHDERGAPRPAVVMRVAAGGGLRSTTADLLRYARAHAAERDPAVRLSHRPTTDTASAGGIALGWEVGRGAGGRRRLSHGGGTLGYSAYLLVYPGRDAGERAAVVCLANQAALEGELERLAAAVADGLLAARGRPASGA